MPIYEFVCKQCDLKFEEMKKVDDFAAHCPVCNGESEKIMSAASFNVSGSVNKSIDSFVGEDAARRWQAIEDSKKNRDKQFGNVSNNELKTKNQKRISGLLDRQKQAYVTLDDAKKKAGITKQHELNHVLKGSNNV